LAFGWHWSSGRLDFIQLEPPEHVLGVFGLVDEGPLSFFLDFKPQK
jgi:hypothetical protein